MPHYGSKLLLPRNAPAVVVHHAPDKIGWQALGPALGCTLLALTVVLLRWYTRMHIARCVGLDDWVILISIILAILMTILTGLQVHHGLSTSTTFSPIEIAKLITVNNALWILTVNTTKASILLQYLRIFSDRPTRIVCFTLLAVLLPVACWGVFAGTFMCQPIAALWDPKVVGTCLNARRYWLSVAGMDIGLDFLILALPLPAVLGLSLPRRQKAGLVLVFGLGFFVCIISVVRLVAVLVASLEGEVVAAEVWAIVWSAVEANVGIVCASLLALKPLVVKVWPGLMEGDMASAGSMRLNLVEDVENVEALEGSEGTASLRELSKSADSEEVLGEKSFSEDSTSGDGTLAIPSPPANVFRSTGPARSHERILDQGWRLEGHEGWGTPIISSTTSERDDNP